MRIVFLLIFSFHLLPLFAQQVALQNWPAKLQLFPRDTQDSALVRISGEVQESGYSEAKLEIYKQSQLWKAKMQDLNYVNGTASLILVPKFMRRQRNILSGFLSIRKRSPGGIVLYAGMFF